MNKPFLVLLALWTMGPWSAGWAADPARLSLEDRQEIQDLLSVYSYTYDAKDADGFVGLFTTDCLWDVYASGSQEPLARATNREELRALATQRLAMLQQKAVQTRHYQTNTVLAMRADGSVEGTTMLNLIWQVAGEKPFTATTGIYRDIFVNKDGQWRIARRSLFMDQAAFAR